MNADNHDMFGIESDQNPQELLSRELSQLPEDKWAPLLADLLRVLEADYKRQGLQPQDAFKQASQTVICLSDYFGGRSMYLPKGERIKIALRDAAAWRRFSGHNVTELAKELGVTDIHMYAILREQRALNLRRIQGQLFQN